MSVFDWFVSMPELLKGALLAAIGFVPTFGWELHKRSADRREREEAALREIGRALSESIATVTKNRRILGIESPVIVNDVPLIPLPIHAVWTAFARDLPLSLRIERPFFDALTACAIQALFINQYADSREIFRNTQKALGGYARGIEGYRNSLLALYSDTEPIFQDCLSRVMLML